jgi:tetratricopeptide (TPR) repeat protein
MAPDLTPEQIDEYNRHYRRAAELLAGAVQVHDAPQDAGADIAGRLRDALEELLHCLGLAPYSYSCLWLCGKAHQTLGEHEAALAYFERSATANAENPNLPREACLEAMALGQAEKALRYALDACCRDPNDAGLVSNLALALTLNNRLDEAVEAAERSMRMAPDDRVSAAALRYIDDIREGRKPMPKRIESTLPE